MKPDTNPSDGGENSVSGKVQVSMAAAPKDRQASLKVQDQRDDVQKPSDMDTNTAKDGTEGKRKHEEPPSTYESKRLHAKPRAARKYPSP